MDADHTPVMDAAPAKAQDAPTPESGLNAGAVLAPAAAAVLLAACGGGSDTTPAGSASATAEPDIRRQAQGFRLPGTTPLTQRDVARFLSQASFGPRSVEEVNAVMASGYETWLQQQFVAPQVSHVGYLDAQRARTGKTYAPEEWAYEAIWQQWLTGSDPLRARVSWALVQIFVISNIAPDLRTYAMSSYMDMLGRNAFGNFRQLLQDVTLHPAMGYYLNMLQSAKEDTARGTHPNENYAREVLQLFSIGLVKLNLDGTPVLDGAGKPIPSYDEAVVKGFAKAFTGWSFAGLDNTVTRTFYKMPDAAQHWVQPMQPWAMFHDTGSKALLDGRVLPAGRTAAVDMADALDTIFNHPNVGPFIGRQLIQRLVTSNPSAAYVRRVASVFNNNGSGVRGDMKAVIRAVLLDPDARSATAALSPQAGKLREPVLRFAQLLRATGAKSTSGRNAIHYLDSPDDALAQSPLLAPSVFNFYSPSFRPSGPLAAAGLVAPEFQITSETSTVGSLNFLASVINSGGYGGGDTRQAMDLAPWMALAADPAGTALIDRINLLFFDLQMSATTRARMTRLLAALPYAKDSQRRQRVKSALMLTMASPDHVIHK